MFKKVAFNFTITLLMILPAINLVGCGAATPTADSPTTQVSATAAPTTQATSASASVAPTYQDLAYANLSLAQKLDLYIPATGSEPFPVVVMVHGGKFMFGDKAGAGLPGVDQLLAAGYAVASINYRLSDEATYPAQIFDAKAAVRFLRANAALYNLNPNKFGAWGASAGGNLVALLGTTCGVAELEGTEEPGYAEQSSCVQAVVDWYGPIDFLKMDSQLAETGCPQIHDAADSPESKLVGAPIQTVPDIVWTTNPMNYITADDAPFFIEHGTADCTIPPAQSKKLAGALSAVISADKVTYVSLQGAGHGGPQFKTPKNLKLIVNFLDKYLK